MRHQFISQRFESALSALVKHKWMFVAALDQHTVLFKSESEDTGQQIEEFRMAARLVESTAARRAIARLSADSAHEQKKNKG